MTALCMRPACLIFAIEASDFGNGVKGGFLGSCDTSSALVAISKLCEELRLTVL